MAGQKIKQQEYVTMKMPSKQFYMTWGIWFLASFVAVFILDGFGAEFAALVAAEASTLYAATILFFPFPN